MNEQTQTPTAGAEATAPASGTAISPWAMKAEALPNKDLHVQTTDAIFDGQTKPVTFLTPQAEEDDGNENVRISFRVDEEITTIEGDKKAPGHVVSPFPRRLRVRDDASAKDKERCAKDLRGLGLDLQAIGLLPKRKDPTLGQIYCALGELEGKQAMAKFSAVNGNQRDPETLEFKKYQNVRFAPLGAGESNGAGVTVAATEANY